MEAGLQSSLVIAHRGARIGIQTSDRGLLERAAAALPAEWQAPSTAPEHCYRIDTGADEHGQTVHRTLSIDGEVLLQTPDSDVLLDRLLSDLHHRIAIAAQDGLFVHAGVVAWQGRTIILPGRTHSGKSTLVAALLERGATYFSDEYAVFDSAGLVHPYPKLLALRAGEAARRLYPPESFGSTTGVGALPPGVVAILQHDASVEWEVRTVTSGAAVLAVLDNTIHARDRSAEALAILARALTGVPALIGRRGEAGQAAANLLELCEATGG